MRTPDVKFLLAHPAHFIALGFGSGLAPRGPGTVGTLLAVALYAPLALVLDANGILVVSVVFFLIGIWACARTGRALGVSDHGAMNWDEVVAFLPVLVWARQSSAWVILGFVVFRFFDIVKPPPIGWIDRTVGGGLGVMLDDVVAAACTVGLLALVRYVIG